MNPREMERYNPFSSEPATKPSADPERSYASQRQQLLGHLDRSEWPASLSETQDENKPAGHYSTRFPDPFGLDDRLAASASVLGQAGADQSRQQQQQHQQQRGGATSSRSNSVTFLHRIGTDDAEQRAVQNSTLGRAASQRGARQAGGFTSFLSRATSVTSSSVTDRVTGAVGSVRSAVDSLSSQIQQAVPSPSGLISAAAGGASQQEQDSTQAEPKQSAASYFASRLSSVSTSNLPGSGGQLESGQPTATICRQRVVLILSELTGTDWAHQFNQYRRLISGASSQSTSSLPFSLFFASQFSSSSSSSATAGNFDGADLIEHVDFKDVSVLANQSSATAAVHVGGVSALGLASPAPSSSTLPINRLALNLVGATVSSGAGQQQQQQQELQQQQQLFLQQQLLQRASSSNSNQPPSGYARTIRPEYVVVRQRGRARLDHLKRIVKALDYCCVPMFEPYDVWSIFQDRQLIFAKLLRVQRQLSKEQFPLIPQVFCQTHRDLLNYIQNSYLALPCLVRTGPLGKGKIRIENLQMLRDFATIMATSEQSCTIEQFLDVKCDLIVQKLGTSLKLFKGKCQAAAAAKQSGESATAAEHSASARLDLDQLRQESLERQQGSTTASSLLSSLISSAGASSQLLRNSSNPTPLAANTNQQNFEKLSEVNARYRRWVEAISREFDNKLDVFCIKIVVAANDREYIVGMRNCSMDFLGSIENQEEDKRSFVELIISKMNTILPKHQPLSRETSDNERPLDEDKRADEPGADRRPGGSSSGVGGAGADKRAHLMSQANVGSGPKFDATLNSRNRSVSMNQGELPARPSLSQQAEWAHVSGIRTAPTAGHGLARRASDRSDSMLTSSGEFSAECPPTASGRQMSLGQSFFDQTSTALSSFQRQSMSFLRRLDTRTGAEMSGAGTPPLSARSEAFFERGYASSGSESAAPAGQQKAHSTEAELATGLKSSGLGGGVNSQPPPKPPPPPPSALMNRQSSLTAARSATSSQRDTSNPLVTPQNSLNQSFSLDSNGSSSQAPPPPPPARSQQQRVIRQNSALSAFEPFDTTLKGESYRSFEQLDGVEPNQTTSRGDEEHGATSTRSTARPKFDTISIVSANSNGSDETTTAEDTMNNLKKTFASIFGDKCE